MALRFMQVFVPEQSSAELERLLEGREIIGSWRDAGNDDRIVIHLLVPAEETEPIMDRLEAAYANDDAFRVVLFPVEAVLPRASAPEPNGGDSDGAGRQVQESVRESGRISREELHSDISEALSLNRVFAAMTVLSAVVAAVGLMRDDVAVIIGAMVIAPLLGPNVAISFSTTLGDLPLLRRALVTNIVGVTLALAVSLAFGAVFAINPDVPAIAQRTQLGVGDLALALAAGSAGTFAYTRGLSGAVIGVMVAVALMPPLVVFGMLLGEGLPGKAWGALLLLVANVVCVNLAGVATFVAQGVRPRTWWEEARAKRATRVAILIWLGLLVALSVILLVTHVSELPDVSAE